MQNNTFSGESLRQKLIVLDEIGSTNDYLKSQLSNFKPLPEWSAIMAKNQTHGRGQRENVWCSEPNSNITFSFVLYPTHLPLSNHFSLNMLISLGIIDWLESIQVKATIKWPNDILIGNKKIAGILIENKSAGQNIKQSVIGIGINVNQKQFFEDIVNTASSILNETGKYIHDLPEACLNLLTHLHRRFQDHKSKKLTDSILLKEYNDNLFRKNIISSYSTGKRSFEAYLLRVDKTGELVLLENNTEKKYYFKEVVFNLQ
ncbi:biotin--[acetyl-CoA-carboxylase] ligase [Sphingobacterium cellulitidis]|uniref:biotin--[acetyl-CoA-carboxylase] ligase n=1 Tax=Sphingobacterium cellulitidis TaxID=1768011 RepID=UPI003C7ECB92